MSSLESFLNSNRFIVLGGHKCGTSSLHAYLKQHPEIVMPRIKGQDILNRPRLTIEDYRNSYESPTRESVFGEVSSVYLQSERACQSIKKNFPNAKLLAILRNPADRAFSNYNVLSRAKKNQLRLQDIIQNQSNPLLKKGLYYRNIKRYLENFKEEQVRILLFDTLVANKKLFFSSLFEFVGVNRDFLPDTSLVVRKGGESQKGTQTISSNSLLRAIARMAVKPFTNQEQRYLLGKKIDNLFIKKQYLSIDLRNSLIEYYSEDILKTQELLNIDLSHWLKKN
jgi:hypothetical protein